MRFETVFVVLLLTTTAFLAIRYDEILTHRISTDRANLWVKAQHAWLESLITYVQEEVPEGEPLFVYGHEAQWYYLSDRYTPRSFSQIYPGMTGDETGEGLSQLIRTTHPRVILQGVLRWPGMPPVPSYTQEFKRTLEELYSPAPGAIVDPPNVRVLRVWRLRK